MNKLWSCVLTGAVMLAIVAPAAAKDRDHGRGHHDANYSAYRKARWNDHDRDDHRGWDNGKKTGWHGSDVPPGQAKRRDHDRDDWARHHRHHRRHAHTADARRPVPIQPRPATRPVTTGRGPVPVPNRTTTASAQKPTGHMQPNMPR